MYKQIGHRPTITEASMHIGSYVQNRNSKGSYGVIVDRPAVSNCWRVMWIQGKNRGSTLISQETELVKAGTKV